MGLIKSSCVLLRRHFFGLNRYIGTLKKISHFDRSNYDVVVVGGGIIGVSTARELMQRYGHFRIAIVEKENKLAKHQTGHNSGVVHAGIYYTPGSLKAKLCVEGMKLAYKYFDENQVPYKKVGKLIVATDDVEIAGLHTLYNRALQNQVPGIQLIDNEKQIRDIEPYCVGKKAIWSPETGIVDYALVTEYFARDFKKMGGEIYLNYETSAFEKNESNNDYPVKLISSLDKHIHSRYVLTCAGLQSDEIAMKSGGATSPRIVPIRGEYLQLRANRTHLIRGNIYPVPDPRLPFLGVHFTLRMNGDVWLGPNAVLAFKKEGYKWSDINMYELLNTVRYPGFQRLAKKHLISGMSEILRSVFHPLQVLKLQRFVPQLRMTDVIRGPAGVRAQAVDEGGQLIEDFSFDQGDINSFGGRILHCRNVPSPGATSSLAIAKMLANFAQDIFKLG